MDGTAPRHGFGVLERTVEACRQVDRQQMRRAVDLLHAVNESGGRIYLMGNGGSATTAAHFACDLTRMPYSLPRTWRRFRAAALTDSLGLLTAWSNDADYTEALALQIKALLDPVDLVVAISVSGNSANIVAGLRAARDMGCARIGLLGVDGGQARELVDVAILVNSPDYGVVETVHLGIAHDLAFGAVQKSSAA
nr:SIS domain-containing protein [Kineosporia babensis]